VRKKGIVATAITRQNSLFYTQRLANGLQMIGQQIPGVESAATVFWVRTGTRDEPAEQMGVSHFLEHMAFRRTEHFSGTEIDRAFEEMGADHNAATWLEMTFYWARVLSENLSRAIDVLAELTHPVLNADDFEQERAVILEEIARYQDFPTHVLMQGFMRDFFDDHPLAWETLGTEETIQALTVDQMREYWKRRYGASNVIFAVAGNFDWDTVVGQVEALARRWQPGETGRALRSAPFRAGFNVNRQDKFVQEQVAIGVRSVPRSDPRYFAAALLATILGDDTGSRLFWALQQAGLAETATAQVMEFEDNGLMLIHLATEPHLAARALETAQSELSRLQDFDVEEAELERAKAKLNSSVIIGGESTNERVMGLIRSWLSYGRLETLEEIRQKIDAVTLDDLRALLDEFPVAPEQVTSAVGPLAENELAAG
jgi:predicted Zn-dependent peptidase